VDDDATACRLGIWILCGLRGNHLQLDERTVAELRNAHEGGEHVALVLLGCETCEIAVLPTLEAIAHLRLSFFRSHAGELSR
jgi:hypothetical protein